MSAPGPERLTRNWNEILQELRVAQTGVQILTGFLLTVPFASRFTDLTDRQVTVYLVVLSGSVLTTALVTAPVAYHRVLFRRREREWLVEAANVTARLGLTTMALTSAGVLFLVFDVVVGLLAAALALTAALACFVGLWAVVPWWTRRS
ncbi:DUF6328 family protein [Nocardioides coralli]|uniref:DUF6328 family protein n=1 Tax=Nocardioides coralli TaxID=2872154 RepID=UPI001CA39DCE|nr:DUF6328 family protein [Nocardioides coralli]QZY29997.1 DUF6328 family protein [Nocardioides coralli]